MSVIWIKALPDRPARTDASRLARTAWVPCRPGADLTEFADATNGRTLDSAVDPTRHIRTERLLPLAELAAITVSKSFYTCVTDGEDAAEHQFSAIHGELIKEVVLRVRVFGDACMDRSIGVAADCFPDWND